MSSADKNLSSQSPQNLQDIRNKSIAIIVSEWNDEITGSLYSAAYQTLLHYGASKKKIITKEVPGSFELPLAAQFMAQKKNIDAVICLGSIIRGETPHFDYICLAVAQGIKDVSLKYNKPVIFGVLTTENKKQALDRAGGKHGNKGDEAAITAIKMLNFQ